VNAAADVRALGVVEFLPPIAQPATGSPFGDPPWEDDGYPEAPWGFFGNVESAQIEIEGDSGHTLTIPLHGYVWGL
jgi:hypothetical protein